MLVQKTVTIGYEHAHIDFVRSSSASSVANLAGFPSNLEVYNVRLTGYFFI